jgi:hypothetical protein
VDASALGPETRRAGSYPRPRPFFSCISRKVALVYGWTTMRSKYSPQTAGPQAPGCHLSGDIGEVRSEVASENPGYGAVVDPPARGYVLVPRDSRKAAQD